MSRHALLAFAVLLFVAGGLQRAHAADPPTSLGEVLDAAYATAPGMRSARADLAISQARERQAYGAMLPQISLTASANGNRRAYNTHDANTNTMRDRYHAHSNQLSLNQPLWHPANVAGWHEAEESEAQARYQLADAEQKLYAKLAEAWFDLMQARDEVEFTGAQRDALKAKSQIAQRGAELGTAGAPEAADAEAKFNEAQADEAAAELQRESKLASIEQWTGPAEDLHQPYLRNDAVLPDLVGEDVDAWLNQLDVHAPGLQAASKAIEAADAEIRKQRDGHKPTLDVVASYGNNDQAVGNFPGQSGYGIRTLTVGLQLNVPLYSGGTQSAKVAEALASRDKAMAERDQARRQAILDIKTAYFEWCAGKARAVAARRGMGAARLAWTAARHGAATGLKTQADVLAARQEWIGARRDMRKASYQQITAYVKLRSTLGLLSADDVDAIDKLFAPGETDPQLDDLQGGRR